MQTKHAPDDCKAENGWKRVEVMKTLGSFVSDSGSCVACVDQTVKQMWSVYHAHVCLGLLNGTQRARFAFIQNSLMSIATWKWARWPFCKTLVSRLDSLQAHFIQIHFPVPSKAQVSGDEYFRRLRLQMG